jgi:hypothetical protein
LVPLSHSNFALAFPGALRLHFSFVSYLAYPFTSPPRPRLFAVSVRAMLTWSFDVWLERSIDQQPKVTKHVLG